MSEADMVEVECESCNMRIRLDAHAVATKRKLQKRVECAICRNSRVSKEMEPADLFQTDSADEGGLDGMRRNLRPAGASAIF